MFWRRARLHRVRTTVVGAVLILLALVAAKLHACAYTGGQTEWHSVYPETQETGPG